MFGDGGGHSHNCSQLPPKADFSKSKGGQGSVVFPSQNSQPLVEVKISVKGKSHKQGSHEKTKGAGRQSQVTWLCGKILDEGIHVPEIEITESEVMMPVFVADFVSLIHSDCYAH